MTLQLQTCYQASWAVIFLCSGVEEAFSDHSAMPSAAPANECAHAAQQAITRHLAASAELATRWQAAPTCC
eukprot:CAMPEP_0114680642 /NCGR_PEP_ID=MMETSP0191-20121206/54403_1 /TAXON_ID=126664 /ORGANISM="Sorites sp." /LENGTH=70 /DNA_ID=CAMNT_0001957771 /DNA_START=106 /DNA_END=318 /DNA_ORIENTATION=-